MVLKRTEFASAVAELARERHIEPELVLESIKAAVLAAFCRDAAESGKFNEDWQYTVRLDEQTGGAKIFGCPQDEKKKDREVTPKGFGRIATQIAKQVILQKIKEAENSAIIDDYRQKIGMVTSGTIIRIDNHQAVVDIGRTYGVLPKSEQLHREEYQAGERFDFYIKEIGQSDHPEGRAGGEKVVLSRISPDLVNALFRREVPEVANGAVEIRGVAREPGVRTKVAVFSNRRGVDPVGACVGQKGVRVSEVIKSLGGEKVDVVQYSEDPEKFITVALLPAEGLRIKVDSDKKIAEVLTGNDQLSLAIGKDGQNVRLASELTGYQINIKEKRKKQVKN